MRIRRFFTAIVFLALAVAAASAQDLTLDQVLKNNEDAIGGLDAISKIQSLKMTVRTLVGGGQMEMRMTVYTKRPNLVRVENMIQGQTIVSAYDGTVGWMINPLMGSSGPQKLDEKTVASIASSDLDEAVGSLARIKAAGHAVELLGKEDVEGSPTYKVKVTRKNGTATTYFLDAGTFLPVKQISKVTQMGQELEVEGYPGNYKKVEGIMFAFSMNQKVGGRSVGQMTIDKIELNEPIDDSIFKMPAAAKPPEKARSMPSSNQQTWRR